MINVYFVVQEKTLALDLAGPAEALRLANRVLAKRQQAPMFCLHYVGAVPTMILSAGMCLADLAPLPALDGVQYPAWVVLLGQEGTVCIDKKQMQNRLLIDWLSQLPVDNPNLTLVSICTGALWLAHAGLLKHRRVTTHHLDLDELAAIEPLSHVQYDCIFVEDGNIASSAGVTTGIDLMVHKIAQICGEVVACEVAQWLVMPHRRSSKDKQYSPLLAHRSHLHPAVHRVQEAISLNPKMAWDLEALAKVAHTSPRNLTRLFTTHTGTTPMNYVTQVRLNLAKTALASGLSVTEVAAQVGFSSDVQLRRAWHKFGEAGTPSQYQQ